MSNLSPRDLRKIIWRCDYILRLAKVSRRHATESGSFGAEISEMIVWAEEQLASL